MSKTTQQKKSFHAHVAYRELALPALWRSERVFINLRENVLSKRGESELDLGLWGNKQARKAHRHQLGKKFN